MISCRSTIARRAPPSAIYRLTHCALTQPIDRVGSAPLPPIFLATGSNDRTVYPRNTKKLAAALRDNGHAVEEKIYPISGTRRWCWRSAGHCAVVRLCSTMW